MGTWGRGLYGNDTTCDVRDRFKKLLQDGFTAQEASDMLIGEFAEELANELERPLVWIALADTAWKLGRLMPEGKEKALAAIEDYIQILKTNTGYDMDEMSVRPSEIERVRELLLSPMRPPVPIPKKRVADYSGGIGDVYAYKLKSPVATVLGLQNEYYVFHTVGRLDWLDNQYPIVYIHLTQNGTLPSMPEEIIGLPYVISDIPSPSNRPISMKERTQWGDYVYRLALMIKSKAEIKRELVYIGNVKEFIYPKDEYIYGDIINTRQSFIKNLERPLGYPWLKKYLTELRQS